MLAFMASVLFVIFPSDTGLFSARNHVPEWSVFWYLLAVYLLVEFWENHRASAALGMWISLALSLGSYEEGYPLVIVTPLILVWLQHGISRRVLWTAVIWYSAPVILLLETLLVFIFGNGGTRVQIMGHIANSDSLLNQLGTYV